MHLPTEKYVRGFLKRHKLTYRSTMSIHKGRAIVDPRTLDSWFDLTKERLLNDPELAECWKDPRRIFNQDETSLCVGSAETPGLTPASAPSSPGTGSTSAVGLSIRVSATEQRRLPTFPRMASPASGSARCPPRDTSTGRCFSRESWLTSWSTVRRRTFPNRCVYSVQFDKILLLSLLPTHDSDHTF